VKSTRGVRHWVALVDVHNEKMVGFGYKQAWLAIREGEPTSTMAALGLRDLGPASWRDGVDLAYLTDDRLILTPRLPGAHDSGWLLVAGRWLLRDFTGVDIAELSATLHTEVQLFTTYRVSEIHGWQRAVDGTLARAFGYIGETGEVTAWRGTPDVAERSVGLPAVLDEETDVLVSEDDVLRVAGAWSVDPTTLDGRPATGPLRAAAV
jgi:hypothetical protein